MSYDDDKEFDAYVDEIMASKRREVVVHLLAEFQDKAYLRGKRIIMDIVHSTLNSFDERGVWKKQGVE